MKYAPLLVAVVFYSCSQPCVTEINRTSYDVNGKRTLFLQSRSVDPGIVVVRADFIDGDQTGFGPGTLITCNGDPIIDTRNIAYQRDTEIQMPIPKEFD